MTTLVSLTIACTLYNMEISNCVPPEYLAMTVMEQCI